RPVAEPRSSSRLVHRAVPPSARVTCATLLVAPTPSKRGPTRTAHTLTARIAIRLRADAWRARHLPLHLGEHHGTATAPSLTRRPAPHWPVALDHLQAHGRRRIPRFAQVDPSFSGLVFGGHHAMARVASTERR